ncbi:DUF5060 domain-containing protein [Rufibacter roseolus]|uniref:DUF5060 domain-containing protein n=1 Tax=Rufibacter roseolus TaxID=2817375 RepID=UPI001B308C48|nr:DUF5060 domain-containing protein [Rufibacter roseolus]
MFDLVYLFSMKASLKVLLLFLLLTLAKATVAQNRIQKVTQPKSPIRQFEKAEWTINLQVPFTNPYDQKEIALDMVLTSPSGKPLVLPCYFEKGDKNASEWKARFAPQEVGTYSWFFRLGGKNISDESKPETFEAGKGDKPGFLHKNDLYTFKFDDGTLFRGIGENVGWESRSFENDKWTYDYLLPTLSKNGANFFRTWMCYWNLPLEWKKVNSTKRYTNTQEYFHPGAIQRMEELLQLCDSLNLYFMLTFDWHGHLMENGGWKNSNYNQANGGPAKTPTEFFTLQRAREKYKNKLRYIVARWGYSTNIAVWEFFNEVDNAAFTAADSVIIPHEAITQWHDDMSRYLKDIDPYQHLVSTSISHRDIAGMNAIAYLDFNQKHIYKHTEKIPAIYPTYISTFGKPYVVGEFGYRWEDADPKYGEEWDYDYKRGLWYGLFNPTPILPMTWWWELFDDRNMTPYFNSVKEINDQMLASGNGTFEPFPVLTDKIEAYGMKCGNKYFVYLLNNSATELTSDISFDLKGGKIKEVQAFAPVSRQYQNLSSFKTKDQRLLMPQVKLAPRQEMVLILSGK